MAQMKGRITYKSTLHFMVWHEKIFLLWYLNILYVSLNYHKIKKREKQIA